MFVGPELGPQPSPPPSPGECFGNWSVPRVKEAFVLTLLVASPSWSVPVDQALKGGQDSVCTAVIDPIPLLGVWVSVFLLPCQHPVMPYLEPLHRVFSTSGSPLILWRIWEASGFSTSTLLAILNLDSRLTKSVDIPRATVCCLGFFSVYTACGYDRILWRVRPAACPADPCPVWLWGTARGELADWVGRILNSLLKRLYCQKP